MRNTVTLILIVMLTGGLMSSSRPDQELPSPASPIIGRWDLTIDQGWRKAPSWLEVKLSGNSALVGQFVHDGGSARPISKVNFKDGKVSFTIPPQWEQNDKDMVFEGIYADGKLSGKIYTSRGETHSFTGERAPSLMRSKPVVWGTPIRLFNGKDLKGWHTNGPKNQWKAVNGVLTSPQSGENIITDGKYEDFKLHIEFRYPSGSNSGVYLRGRYEVQVEDNYGVEPTSTLFSGVYGFLTPNAMMAKKPGEWQSFDITLVGRLVTVVANGKPVIIEQNIPGITGGALDSREGEPGPIMLQGDHGPIEYRNIILTPAR